MTSLEARLARAEQELADLHAEYRSVMYAVTHDLSAPLRAIEGFSALVSERNIDKLDEKDRKYFDCISSGSRKMKGILDVILHFSRLDSVELALTQVDLNQLLAQVQQRLASRLKQSQGQICSAHLPTVIADKSLLTQLFQCLLDNALLYQKEGSQPVVHILLQEFDDHWQFCVQDTGIGVRERAQERIFLVLNRAVAANEYPGAGMGLAVARKILSKHQGRIWIESKPDEGSCFYFTLLKTNP